MISRFEDDDSEVQVFSTHMFASTLVDITKHIYNEKNVYRELRTSLLRQRCGAVIRGYERVK